MLTKSAVKVMIDTEDASKSLTQVLAKAERATIITSKIFS